MCKHAVPNWTCYTSLLVYVTLNIGYHNGFKNKKYKSHINHGNIALHCSLWGFFHLWIWQGDKIIRPALEAFLFFPLSWSINILRSSIFCCASTTWYHHCDKTVYTSMLQLPTELIQSINIEYYYMTYWSLFTYRFLLLCVPPLTAVPAAVPDWLSDSGSSPAPPSALGSASPLDCSTECIWK